MHYARRKQTNQLKGDIGKRRVQCHFQLQLRPFLPEACLVLQGTGLSVSTTTERTAKRALHRGVAEGG